MRLGTCLFGLTCLLLPACETTPEIDDPLREGEQVTIPGRDMEPVARFVLETRRLLVAEFVRIEMTPQFFEQKMGVTRDPRFVDRRTWREEDGTRVIEIKNINKEQETNIDPDLLPRVYFGSGLEVRAYNTIRIYLRSPKTRERPLFLNIMGKNSNGDAKLWVSGRLQLERPEITIAIDLLWSEGREHYVSKSHIG